MCVGKYAPGLALAFLAVFAIPSAAQAEDGPASTAAGAYGTIVGVVANAARRPIGGATVTAVREGGGVRATISGSDGVYSFADVPLGNWSLTATVDGASESVETAVNVAASRATRRDILMNVSTPAVASTPIAPQVATASVPEALQTPDPDPEVDRERGRRYLTRNSLRRKFAWMSTICRA
jgi:hypothetical protein